MRAIHVLKKSDNDVFFRLLNEMKLTGSPNMAQILIVWACLAVEAWLITQ